MGVFIVSSAASRNHPEMNCTPQSSSSTVHRRALRGAIQASAAVFLLLGLCAPPPLAAQAGTANPHGALKVECAQCHTMEGWTPLKAPLPWKHSTTGFDLGGAHADAACKACHTSLDFATVKGKADCLACHEPAFRRATRPSHAGFPTTCKTCHGVSAWQPATFDHTATTFQLNGAHRTADCASCHRSGYTATPTDCFSCHQRDFTGARNPVHAGFPNSCQDCHGVSAWQPATFDHNQTGFQLVGAHRTVECTTCHRTGYAGTPSECFSCHQDDFTGARNPVHAGFPNTCRDCHGVTAWQPALFDHNATGFQLNGAHRSTECSSCHRTGYAGTPTDCFSCHQSDFTSARNPSHSGFPNACQDCHGVTAWQPATFDHNTTGFQLNGAHRSASCTSCHRTGYAGTPTDCFSCHQSDFTGARNPSHSGFPNSCQDCHGVSAWQPATFDHNTTGFQLNGAHRSATCTSCHRTGYAGTPSDCFSCHQSDFTGASNPSHSGFPNACQDCHGVSAWQPANFDHNTTGFQLNGAHRSASCTSCHRSGYAGTPTDCFSCHQSDFTGATNPSHSGFPNACQDCHGVSAWQPATFNHNATGFQLNGAHRSTACISCHRTGYAGTPSDCFSCHQTDFTGATNPSHTGFPNSCQDCHGVSAWQPANFDHNSTGFQLNGAHRSAACTSCHRSGYAGTPTDCFSCHQSDFTGATNPSHSGFPNSCQDCHGVSAWQPANFNHAATAFPLNGAHRTTACSACHQNGYNGTPTDCFSCHQTDFNGANNPSHTGFPHACQDCHSVNAWQPASFDHNATGFPLNGAHRTTACTACHQNGYNGTPTDCFSCHQTDFNGANNPSHTGFPHTCQDCHGVTAWQPATFNHNSTGFPLNGAHQATPCLSCHSGGYNGTPTDCFSCHQSDFNGANNPSHSGFPHSCQDCHSVNAWQPASFNHNSTGFPLHGAHLAASCLDCHSGGYSGTPTACFSCHQTDFNGANNPSHTGFPHTCQDCHSDNAWQPASFNHTTTGFPLTGAHAGAACLDCHSGGYSGTPTLCFACHQADYNGTNDPDHQSAGFPTTCETCHSTTAWEPSTFNHNAWFPIASGRHQFPCSSCHVSAGNFNHFECILCHEHRQSETNSEHQGVGGYVYESHACFQCHPRGSA